MYTLTTRLLREQKILYTFILVKNISKLLVPCIFSLTFSFMNHPCIYMYQYIDVIFTAVCFFFTYYCDWCFYAYSSFLSEIIESFSVRIHGTSKHQQYIIISIYQITTHRKQHKLEWMSTKAWVPIYFLFM